MKKIDNRKYIITNDITLSLKNFEVRLLSTEVEIECAIAQRFLSFHVKKKQSRYKSVLNMILHF